MKQFIILLLIFLTGISCSKSEDPEIEVQPEPEEVYINELYAAGDDWIELYNSSDQDLDIGGYAIYDKAEEKYLLPAGTALPAKGFLIIYCDGEGNGLHTTFKLAAEGEVVHVANKAGKLIDRVAYPALTEEQCYGRFPDGSATLAPSGNPTPGASNGANQAPVFRAVTQYPLVPRPEDAVTIRAELEQTGTATMVTLYYQIDQQAYQNAMMTMVEDGVYEWTIPALGQEGGVVYYIAASNGTAANTSYPATAPEESLSYLITTDVLPMLMINEFMAANSGCCKDPAGVDEYDDWLEIYNAGSEAINLAGMYVSDDKANPYKYRIPNIDATATTLAPGGYLLIWADEQEEQGPLHANFKLSVDGEDIGIYYLDGRTIDEYSFGAQATDISLGRKPNGGSTWFSLTTPTPGTSNE